MYNPRDAKKEVAIIDTFYGTNESFATLFWEFFGNVDGNVDSHEAIDSFPEMGKMAG